ncbi:flagellar protein FlgN [Alkalihalobacillus trypoxylicola]|uniref:FlgN protein n=1 Tax=Alkalihalobacillus trypoxylicola TaxID=519424 RepID=A0A162ETN6_9BACI|nr:flagellar protein FlgN [Alkalihalobacillus trypoxylicola]KYG33694.1 hypothetical protein AZF04_15835 [Alkalihalobacillus trypoxylicola]
MTFEKVKLVLQQLIDVHETLYQLAKKKSIMITKNQMPELEWLLREETKSVQKLRMIDSIREREVTALLNNKGYKGNEPILAELLKVVSEEEKESLLNLQEELLEKMTLLRKKNQHNQELLEESINFVHFSLELLSPQLSDHHYHPDHDVDQEQNSRTSSVFDSKA